MKLFDRTAVANRIAWRGLITMIAMVLPGVTYGTANDSAGLKTDHSLLEALKKSDKTTVGSWLDSKFTWTNEEGKTRSKAETLNDLSTYASDSDGYANVKSISYKELSITYGVKDKVRFVRVWVKRPAGWRALIDLDTPVKAGSTPIPPPSTGDCDNPCRTLPYTPKTAKDKALLMEWQKTKLDEWHPDAADWGTHIADEFMLITEFSARNKTERVEFGKKVQAAGISMPGDPILSMGLEEFGNAAVMITNHSPYHGGKPYYNLRVFVNREGHWLLAWSQQTFIQAATNLPAVDSKH